MMNPIGRNNSHTSALAIRRSSRHPATYIELAGVSFAGLGPLVYAFHDGLISVPGWASFRYFAEQAVLSLAPALIQAGSAVLLIAGFFVLARWLGR